MLSLTLDGVIESLLMSASSPLTLKSLHQIVGDDFDIDQSTLLEKLRAMQLNKDPSRGVCLVEVASGFRFQSKSEAKPWIEKLLIEKPLSHSRVLMEVAAIVAYHQPVTRGDIEKMRGVTTQNNVVRQLIDLNWIRIVGQKDAPGKPELLGSTKVFLDYFNLKSLSELPSVTANL